MKNIYLIAYYFKPYKGVGALRLSYWYDKFKNEGYQIKVLTATDGNQDGNIVFINPNCKYNIIKDKSLIWGYKCVKYLKKVCAFSHNDIFIITGGPFLQMYPLLQLKKKYQNTIWILDYRDPLTGNRRNYSFSLFSKIKYFIKKIYEKNINSKADKIITVNEVCRNLIRCENKAKIYIIDNGYDERCFNTKTNFNYTPKSLVYAGKLYKKDGLAKLFAVIESLPNNYSFTYIGPDPIFSHSPKIYSLGQLNYDETIRHIEKSEIGVIFTSGDPFESTTKVFDYIGAQKKILIITQGIINSGFLNEILRENPNVEWSSDRYEAIATALKKLARPYVPWNHQRFMRKEGYNKLKGLIG